MRYLKYTYGSSTSNKKKKRYWFFDPPRDIKEAGVLSSCYFKNKQQAKRRMVKINQQIDEWRANNVVLTLSSISKLDLITKSYLQSAPFNALKPTSKKKYRSKLQYILDTIVNSERLGSLCIQDITSQICTVAYTEWSNTSVAHANEKARIISIVFNYAISLDIIEKNPMAYVKKAKHKPHSPVWTKDQVEKFVATAFSKWEYRAIGLIALLAYEWAQRPIDIRLLKWDQINLDKNIVYITQEKRGETVELPITKELADILKKQKEDFPKSEWVIPNTNLVRKVTNLKPLGEADVSEQTRKVLKEAGLTSTLQARHLRKTAIVEMVEGGATAMQIKTVTGHSDISSLNPYMKNTVKNSTEALRRRLDGSD